jgi:4-hydroxythreonine-4-phosphate dehydrogenase
MKNRIIAGIAQGDSNGIGYEVIIKSLADSRIFDICTPVIYGSSKMFGYYKKFVQDAENLIIKYHFKTGRGPFKKDKSY